MGTVQFEDAEACGGCAPGRGGECVDDCADLVDAQLGRTGQTPERYGAGANGAPAFARLRPGPPGGPFAAGVNQLNARHRALGADEVGDPSKCHRLPVVPQTGVVHAAASHRIDGGGLDHHQRGACHRPRAQVLQMPIRRRAFVRPLGSGGELHHRRHPRPVRERDLAQRERGEQMRHQDSLLRRPRYALAAVISPARPGPWSTAKRAGSDSAISNG